MRASILNWSFSNPYLKTVSSSWWPSYKCKVKSKIPLKLWKHTGQCRLSIFLSFVIFWSFKKMLFTLANCENLLVSYWSSQMMLSKVLSMFFYITVVKPCLLIMIYYHQRLNSYFWYATYENKLGFSVFTKSTDDWSKSKNMITEG